MVNSSGEVKAASIGGLGGVRLSHWLGGAKANSIRAFMPFHSEGHAASAIDPRSRSSSYSCTLGLRGTAMAMWRNNWRL